MNEIEPVVKDLPRVSEFYRGRTIFLTGFSGFLGRATVEKLLWSCPDIKAIYVLLREKRGMSCEERLKTIINSDCFDRVRKHREGAFEKVIAIQGDVLLPGLGISEEDRSKIISDVNIVIHSAASVKFDDPLTLAMDLNFKGTKSMLDLATKMTKLQVFVYVSTAFSNCDKFHIEEKMYEPHANWSDMLKVRDKIDETVINTFSAKCRGNMPNTYIFTKNLAEHMVYDHRQQIPVVIYRPSIVVNSMNEPFPGWIEGLNSPTSILLGRALGVLRTTLENIEGRMDFIPCDTVIRYLLFIILLKPYQRKGMAPVYNASVSGRGPSNKDVEQIMLNIYKIHPMKYSLWKPVTHMTTNYVLFYVYFMAFHLLPAVFVDLILKLLGKETRLVKLQTKIFIAMTSVTHFTLNQFYFDNQNGYFIQDYVHPDDHDEMDYYNIKTDKLTWENHFFHSFKYMSNKFLKQTPEDHSKAKKNQNLLVIADVIVKSGFYIICAWLIYKYEVVQTLTTGTFNFITNF